MIKRILSLTLIFLHIATFGPMREAAAFFSSGTTYNLNADLTGGGSAERAAIDSQNKIAFDVIGEPCVGEATSTSYILNAGFISVIQSNPPALKQEIPDYYSWPIDSSKNNAFDLDDYFTSPEGYALTYQVSGNNNIKVTIDPDTHIVTFIPNPGWFGAEKIHFIAKDTESNTFSSNDIVLQVAAPAGTPNKPVIVYAEFSPLPVKEGDAVTLTVKAVDLNGKGLKFEYTKYFLEAKTWQEGNLYYSEATWQVPPTGKNHYPFEINVTEDPAGLTVSQSMLVNVGNRNNPPVFPPIADIIASEGQTDPVVKIEPRATDADHDYITYYYSAPFDAQGNWFPGYDDAGVYNVRVTASDSIDMVSQMVKVTVNNTNRPPQAKDENHPILKLSEYTVKPNEQLNITVAAVDKDGDPMTFILKRDGAEIASGNLTSEGYTTTTSFSEIAQHNISVTVTDSGGLSASDSARVEVTDPNVDRNAINPVMGDFNGDALSDLGLYNSDSAAWEICLADKLVPENEIFKSASLWLKMPEGLKGDKNWWPMGGDFDGDAKTDVGLYNNTTGEFRIAASTGSGFSDKGIVFKFNEASYSWQPFTGNFNADKYTDFALYNKDTGEVRVALGNKNSFEPFKPWTTTGLGNDYIALGGDFNGDGLTDLCLFKKASGEFKVAFSNAAAFVDSKIWPPSFAVDKDVSVSDFNNDGLTDVGYWDKESGKWYYAISTGDKFEKQVEPWLESFGSNDDDSATTGDFDGNGITDAAVFDKDLSEGIKRWKIKLSTNKPADLLNLIKNGIGGETKVIYTYAAASENGLLPFPVYVASKISLINTYPTDRTATYTQEFSFSGGYFDAGEREFRGFEKVKVSDPITNNYTETYFYQSRSDSSASEGDEGAKKGQIRLLRAYDGNKHPISEVKNTYTVQKAGPEESFLGYPALTELLTTVYEENGAPVTTKDNITYDNIGNVIEAVSLGAKDSDKRSTATIYSHPYDTDVKNGFNRPTEVSLKDKDGNIVTKKNFEYDEKGNLVKDVVSIIDPADLANPTGKVSITQYVYDTDYGNLISTTNALGNTVTTYYEEKFHAYPERVVNALGHSLTYIYEPKFGAVKSVTDTNGATTSTAYDALGRPMDVTNANGEITTRYAYADDFRSKTTTNALGLFKKEYIDGLGRKYKTVASGEDGANQRNVSTEVFFNNRGLTDKESLPHYVDEDSSKIAYSRYEYDLRGRVKKTIADFPGVTSDAESSINYITPLYVETIDPLGRRKGTLKDVYGNIIEIKEFVAGEAEAKADGAFHTYYKYDIQNNLVETRDNKENITQIFYDSIGRKTKMIDPDMGTWAYAYDAIGNLIKQTDAKGQVLVFEYDKINRLAKKSLRGASAASDEAIAEYFYDGSDVGTAYYAVPTIPKEYCKGRLSKVVDRSGSTEFFYDKLGREIKSVKGLSPQGTVPEQYMVQREYDVLDRLTKLTYPDGEIINYAYDSNSGLLERVYTNDGIRTTNDYIKDITYNAKGQIKTIQYGNNTQTAYDYGSDLRLSNIRTTNDEQRTTLQDLIYKFDTNGNVTSLTDNVTSRRNTRKFSYDRLDRLVEEQKNGSRISSYQYNSIGNMIFKSEMGVNLNMTYNSTALTAGGQVIRPHAVISAAGYTYQYDANGNMTRNRNKDLVYDAENRLTQVTDGSTITSFAYDGDGGLVHSSLRGGAVGADEAISTTYIGSLYEKGSDGTVKKHIFAGSTRVATNTIRASAAEGTSNNILRASSAEGAASREETVYYHPDHLGSSNVITDKEGKQAAYYEYAPYGTTSHAEGGNVTNYKFTGKQLFDSTGLYHYGARFYDPVLGRFITADTIVQASYDPQSLNRYAYCRNNPLNYTDPSGHSWLKWLGKILGVVAAAVTFVATWNPVAAFAAFNITDTVISGAQAMYYGASPGIVLGAIAISITLNILVPSPATNGDILWQIGASAFRGAAISSATTASFGGDVGEAAAWGGGMAGLGGFLSSQQFTNQVWGDGFRTDTSVNAENATLSKLKAMLTDEGPTLMPEKHSVFTIRGRNLEGGDSNLGKVMSAMVGKRHHFGELGMGVFTELQTYSGLSGTARNGFLTGSIFEISGASRVALGTSAELISTTIVYGSALMKAAATWQSRYDGKRYSIGPDDCRGYTSYLKRRSSVY